MRQALTRNEDDFMDRFDFFGAVPLGCIVFCAAKKTVTAQLGLLFSFRFLFSFSHGHVSALNTRGPEATGNGLGHERYHVSDPDTS